MGALLHVFKNPPGHYTQTIPTLESLLRELEALKGAVAEIPELKRKIMKLEAQLETSQAKPPAVALQTRFFGGPGTGGVNLTN